MRRAFLGLLSLLAASGQSAASSFVTLPAAPPTETPSIVMLGEPAAPVVEARALASTHAQAEIYQLSPSVLAFGAEAIPAEREAVASIGESGRQPRWMSAALPLVIRGGEHGDAFSPASAPTPASGQAATAAPGQPPQPHAPSRPEPAPPPAAAPAAPFKQTL